ncbi:hypothetical protein [Pantoea sp. AS142]|uniref:hypothetical protein n=1 Tax=Pantoea sp. AS142 TaxID=3081292 RepID=UPI003017A394
MNSHYGILLCARELRSQGGELSETTATAWPAPSNPVAAFTHFSSLFLLNPED